VCFGFHSPRSIVIVCLLIYFVSISLAKNGTCLRTFDSKFDVLYVICDSRHSITKQNVQYSMHTRHWSGIRKLPSVLGLLLIFIPINRFTFRTACAFQPSVLLLLSTRYICNGNVARNLEVYYFFEPSKTYA